MAKLTPQQREWLTWVCNAGGVTDITDRRIARPMQDRGFVTFCAHDDSYSITEAGRLALQEPK